MITKEDIEEIYTGLLLLDNELSKAEKGENQDAFWEKHGVKEEHGLGTDFQKQLNDLVEHIKSKKIEDWLE